MTTSQARTESARPREARHETSRAELLGRLASGEFGALRVIVMLVVIWAVFQVANDRFLSAINLTNLMLQITAVGMISVGVALVLLLGEIDLSVAAVSGLAAGVVAVLNVKSGWPAPAAIAVGLAVGAAIGALNGVFVTRLGLPSFGNAEAARRAGIRVTRIRMVVFSLASMLAAAGGILAASRLLAVNQSSGGGDLLLLAIAGPVIAGVSLFGGRGSVWAALLGAVVIGSISNGMDLLALESSVKFMITGAVLLAAVSIDAASRLRSQPTS